MFLGELPFVELLYGIKYFLVSLSDIETIFHFIEKPNFGNMLHLCHLYWSIFFAVLRNLVSRDN